MTTTSRVTAAVVALALGTAACAGAEERTAPPSASTTTDDVEPSTTSSTTSTVAETTTTTAATTTTTAAEATTTTAAAAGSLRPGARGEAVLALQRRLRELRFDPGPADGSYGTGTQQAVWAVQKILGQRPTGEVSAELSETIRAGVTPAPLQPDGGADRVEVDLPRQLMFVYRGGALALISHVSTGTGERYCQDGVCSTAVTPGGAYRFTWRVDGWRTSRLGRLYNPVYFNGGIAVHGAASVPLRPASHGCVRIPMHIAEYFPSLVDRGDAVYVFDGRRAPRSYGQQPEPATTPDTSTSTTAAPRPTTTTAAPATTTTAAATTTTAAPTTTVAPSTSSSEPSGGATGSSTPSTAAAPGTTG